MLKARIAVLVSGGGTNLQALINAEQNGALKSGKLSLVVSSNPTAYALERAKAAAIPCITVDKKAFINPEAFEAELLTSLSAANIDLIILAGFMCILSKSFTDHYPERIINVHPSLIPSFCGEGYYGLRVHKAALDYGVKVTGATVHYVNEIPDGGSILLQKAVEIHEGDTPELLQQRVMQEAEWLLLPQAAELVAAKVIDKNPGCCD